MQKKNPFQQYKKTDIMTASKENILLMLYDGAIRFLKKSIDASNENNLPDKNTFVGKTMDIVNELRATLNHKADADLANRLEQLYDFVLDRLLKGSLENNPKYLEEALGILNTLRDGWNDAIKTLKEAQP
jgi:flagellar protein FliS